jgi:hypothetical protein
MVRRRLSNTKTPRKMAQIYTRKTRQPGRVGREMHDRGRGSGRRRRGRMGARLSSSRCRVCRVKAGSSTVRVKSARSRARKKGSRLGGWCPLRAVGVTRFQCSPLHEALCVYCACEPFLSPLQYSTLLPLDHEADPRPPSGHAVGRTAFAEPTTRQQCMGESRHAFSRTTCSGIGHNPTHTPLGLATKAGNGWRPALCESGSRFGTARSCAGR